MPGETKAAVRLEIGHVLFIDIVGYSKLLISEQSELLGALNNAVREAGEFRSAEADGQLVRLPTGDGMALVFRHSPEQPVRCALEISQALKNYPKLQVRMGIHSGPVNEVADVNERANIAGAGINIAQRVMDCGDAGHILLSKHVAEDLQHYLEWRPYLHDVGQGEVKHEEMISIVNLYTRELGNPNPPRLKRARTEVRRRRRNAFLLAGSGMAALLAVGLFLLPRAFAGELQAKLSPSEKAQFEHKPTENGEAYLAFVQGHDLSCTFEDFEKLKQGEQLFERALNLDPNFALAVARYSQLESWIVHTFDPTPARREKARALAERALQLQPDLPEAHLARGVSYYYGDNDYDAALKEFEIAQRGLPNESEIYLYIGSIQRRQGKWAESTANMEKAVSLSPKDAWALQNLSFNYQMTRNFEKANKTIDRALALNPTAIELWEVKSKLAIADKGDFSVAERGF